MESLGSLNAAERRVRDVVRYLCTFADTCELDDHGRALIPQNLREYAGLAKEIYVNGVRNRVEIWDKAAYEDYRSATLEEGIEGKLESLQINL
jgi:MraZ protein